MERPFESTKTLIAVPGHIVRKRGDTGVDDTQSRGRQRELGNSTGFETRRGYG